jgi:hypothetical protein
MSSLKWLAVWGMVNYSPPTAADVNKWSRGMKHILDDPKGLYYFEKFAAEKKLPLPESECTHFQNFTIRPITCNFK